MYYGAVYTTHLVAANPHTHKVHQARRCKSVHVVTPNWLWCCMERWEKVEERLFPLTPSSIITRNPPHHCCAPYFLPNTSRQNSLDLYFMEDQAKESMMEEVEELLGGDDDSSEGGSSSGESDEKSSKRKNLKHSLDREEESNSSNDDSNTGNSGRFQNTRGSRKRRKLQHSKRIGPANDRELYDDDGNSVNFDDDDDELPSVKFRRGEAVRGVRKDSEDDGSSNSCDMEALDSGEEERLMRMEEELMDS
ncbi:BRCT domain [Trinorchestia longiramus]|nr:BRCT domain [Trinorchestia longiramus]